MKLSNMASSLFWFCSILVVVTPKTLEKDKVIEGTELELAFMVHRHGDRTPVEDNLYLVENTLDLDQVLELVEPWEDGQLTDEGKRRGYRTGEFIKQRYNDQLSWRYNRSEIYIRSTDSTRTKMTVLTALSAIYPAVGQTWSPFIDWVPVPYTTIQPKYDVLLYLINCPTYMDAYEQLKWGPAPSILQNHADLLEKTTQMTGVNFTNSPAASYSLFDAYVSIEHLGFELTPDILEIMPGLQEVADESMKILFGSDEQLSVISGPLLKEFFDEAEKVMSGESTQKIRIYSAHDVNVYGFEVITGVTNLQGVPKYGSLYSLELRRVVDTGEYVVLPVYLTTPEEPAIYLQLEGCENFLCPYDSFYNRTSSKAISEAEWREQCQWSEDIIIDTTIIG